MNIPWVSIGYVRRPHGILGYVKTEALSDVPGRFKMLTDVWLEFPDGRRETVRIEKCRDEGPELLIKFETIDTLEAAARLRGSYIQIQETDIAPLPEGEFYVFALIGSWVVAEDGHEIGIIREIMPMPAHDVFVVDTPAGEALIPAVREVVTKIDPENRCVVVRPIPGLID